MNLVPQLGLPELLVLAVLILFVVGPKDLPKFLRGAGQMLAKVRRLADEFRSGLDQMVREAEMEDMRKEIEALKKGSVIPEMDEAMSDIERSVNKDKGPAKPIPQAPAASAGDKAGDGHG